MNGHIDASDFCAADTMTNDDDEVSHVNTSITPECPRGDVSRRTLSTTAVDRARPRPR